MEEVPVLPTVADNGCHAAVPTSSNVVSSVSVEEKEHRHIDGDAGTGVVDVGALVNAALKMAAESDAGSKATTTECGSPVCRTPSTRKKRGAFSLFRAVLNSAFNGSASMKKREGGGAYYDAMSPKKIKAADEEAAGAASWKSLVDGVRPLRLPGQDLEYYPPPPPLGHGNGGADVYHDVLLPPPSPAWAGAGSGGEPGMTSRYASAQDLHQMDCGGDDDDDGDAPAAEGGGRSPNAIDMQAEEFIAKFYEQFKSESFNGRASE